MGESIIKVSADGVDVRAATGSNVLFSASNPFAMLDTQNTVSFQNIRIFMSKDVPPTSGTGDVTTVIYQFPHGYSYTPQTWMMYQNQGASGGGSNPTYGYERTVIKQLGFDVTYMELTADDTNVYISIRKVITSSNIDLTAYTFLLRVYVFVQDVGI